MYPKPVDNYRRRNCSSVSVVGTVQPGSTIERLAEDYAECARLAAEHGADTVETNLSCPMSTPAMASFSSSLRLRALYASVFGKRLVQSR